MTAEFRVGALCAKRHAQTTFDCETEELDVAKEFILLPLILETIQALKKTTDPQELNKKVYMIVKYLCWCVEKDSIDYEYKTQGQLRRKIKF